MSRLVAGIDPGKTGGYAIFNYETMQIVDAGKLELDNIKKMFLTLFDCEEILIERAQAAPGQAHQFEYGRGFGRIETAAILTGAQVYYCSSVWWKSRLNVPTDKAKALAQALQMFPELKQYAPNKGDHGTGEAALIASVLLHSDLRKDLFSNNEKRAKPKKPRPQFRLQNYAASKSLY